MYMRRYPQEAKPPDLSFPNWEGPVLIMQLFGISDVSIGLVHTGCVGWICVGAITMLTPVSILSYGIYKVFVIHSQGCFKFNAFKHQSFKEIYSEAKTVDGWHRKFFVLFVDLHDTRYKGDWAKTSAGVCVRVCVLS